MTASELIALARARGLSLRPSGEDSLAVGPRGLLDPELRRELQALKHNVLAELRDPRRCANCHGMHPVMLAMEPGLDGEEWSLCARCW